MTSIKQHKLNTSFRKSSTFSSINNDENVGESSKKMIETKICDPSISGDSNDIVSEVTLDLCFDLDDFLIPDEGITNTDGNMLQSSDKNEY